MAESHTQSFLSKSNQLEPRDLDFIAFKNEQREYISKKLHM